VIVIVLAAVSSLGYGVADFAGGLAARRAPALRVAAVSMLVSLAIEVALLPVLGARWTAAALLWGGASGLASAAASALLYQSLALGPMSVLSPVTAVISAALPAAAGIAAGERLTGPGAAGVLLALAAVVAVSTSAGPGRDRRRGDGAGADAGAGPRARRPSPVALLMALGAGAGIAGQLICLSRSPRDSGLAPLVTGLAVSAAVLLASCAARGRGDGEGRGVPARRRSGPRRPGPAAAAGVFNAGANLAFLIAVRGGTLVVVAVIVALYPAGTVLLARQVLAERLTRWQVAGLAAAAAAVTLLALG
jgi:drug/metabolite transporter (DMT)-like permease